MNPQNCKNIVAKILQYYAYLNAAGGVLLAFTLGDGSLGILIFAIVLVASFFIYALGEIIELLNEIKLNSGFAATKQEAEEFVDDLPEI